MEQALGKHQVTNDRERLTAALRPRYRIERELGSGGMATVYLAEDLKHHRQVAIKVLKPELATAVGPERFLREIEIAAKLTHPHILTLIDSGQTKGFLYYVMPYVEGESLRDRLQRERQLPLEDAISIVAQVADALSHAHRLGIVHRDIKPENILFEASHAVVADFGIARAVSAAGGERLTETGIAVGTPAYMSPEQASGAEQVDGRSDLYALACLLYEMLGGDPPFTGSSVQAILARHLLDPPPSLRSLRAALPEAVEPVLLKALAKTPADRYATPTHFAEALAQASHAAERTVPGWRWRPVPVAAAAGVIGAAALGVGWWALTASDLPTEQIRSLVVLPLDNLTGDPEQEYFVEGMHEALTVDLARISALRVISRTSAMRYRGTDKSVPEIARELGVDGVIEGSVAREGDQVRITLQLIHGPLDHHLWADTYQRELRNVLALQSDVARAITEQIEVTLAPHEAGRLATNRQVDPAAYDEYLKGQYEWNKLTREGWEAAIGHFQQSIERDPSYAPAYAMMSFAYSLLGYYSRMPPAVLYSRGLVSADRAVVLDSLLAEAHASLALVKTSFDWDWSAADRASLEAVRLNPNSPMALYARAFFLTWVGRHDEAITVAQQAVELDPVAPWVNTMLGMHYFMARRYDEAIEQLNKVVALEPNYRDGHIWLRYCYAKKKLFEEAARESAIVTGSRQSGWADAWILAVVGKLAEAREVLEQSPNEERRTPYDAYFLAIVLGELGEKDRAFFALEQAYQGRTPLMSLLKVDPRIDALRDDPRFQQLLQRMNFPN
jgi:serine/threonine-protein kinase